MVGSQADRFTSISEKLANLTGSFPGAGNANTMIEKAIEHHRQGELEAAGNLYRAMLEEEPNNFEVMHLYAILKHDSGNVSEAITLARKAIDLNPEAGGFHNTLGIFLQKSGDSKGARASFSKAIEKNPNIAHAYNNLGYLQMTAGETEEAEKTLRLGYKLEPDFVELLTNLGNVLVDLDQVEEATKHLKRATDLSPDSAAAQASLGRAFLAQHAPGLAVQCLRNALNRRPNYHTATMLLGQAQIEDGDADGAVETFQRACELRPDAIEPLAGLADACRKAGRFGEALTAYQKIVAKQPENPGIALAVGDTYSESGDSEAAIKCYQATAIHEPRNARAHLSMGRELRKCGYYAEAIDSLSTARDLRPGDAEPLAELAAALELNGQQEIAEATADQALKLDASNAVAVLIKARSDLAQANAADAVKRLAAATEVHAGSKEEFALLRWLGRAQDAAGDYSSAWKSFTSLNQVAARQEIGRRLRRPASTIPASVMADWPREAPADGRPTPVFLIGLPGSGLDEVTHALARHPQIAVLHDRVRGGGDRRDFLRLAAELENPAQADETEISLQRRRYWRAVQQLTGVEPERMTWIDRLPAENPRLDLVFRYFPEARVLIVRRHTADQLLQCFADGDLARSCGEDVEAMRERLESISSHVRELRKSVPLSCHGVDSGLLHTDYQGLMGDLLAFLKVEWDDSGADHEYQKPGEPGLFEPGHWQKYQDHLATADLSNDGE